MSERFRVMHVEDAVKAGYLEEWYTRHDDFFYVLLDFKNPDTPVLIATDHGEPEDNSFTRSYAWVAPLLNKLARGDA